MKLSSEQKLALKKLRKGKQKEDDKDKESASRVAALEKQLEDQAKDFQRQISALKSERENANPLPPAPQRDPLQPPESLNQRGGGRR